MANYVSATPRNIWVREYEWILSVADISAEDSFGYSYGVVLRWLCGWGQNYWILAKATYDEANKCSVFTQEDFDTACKLADAIVQSREGSIQYRLAQNNHDLTPIGDTLYQSKIEAIRASGGYNLLHNAPPGSGSDAIVVKMIDTSKWVN